MLLISTFSFSWFSLTFTHTAKTKCRKFETNIPKKGISSVPNPNFHIHVSVSELYISTMGRSVLLEEICRLILGIYKSLRHECGNWGWGRAIPRKGIYKRNCRCSAHNTLRYYRTVLSFLLLPLLIYPTVRFLCFYPSSLLSPYLPLPNLSSFSYFTLSSPLFLLCFLCFHPSSSAFSISSSS